MCIRDRNMAARVKHKLEIKNRKCITYDMIFGCPGWVEAMILADDLIKLGKAKTILVVGGETLSRVTDPYDRNKMIFADGAGAVVVQKTDEENVGIITTNTVSYTHLDVYKRQRFYHGQRYRWKRLIDRKF